MFQRLFLQCIAFASCATIFGDQAGIQRYVELNRNYPVAFGPKGDWQKGESETVVDFDQMCEIEAQFARKFLNKGMSVKEALERSRLGVVSEDGFWVWVREPLLFPNGTCDIYNRFIHKNSLRTPPGTFGTVAAVLAVLPNDKIVLNLMFRNATRSWEIELPRGGRDLNESAEEAARREVKEETGYEVGQIELLGTFPIDSAVIRDFYHVFFAKTVKEGDSHREEGELIASLVSLTKEEAKQALCNGYFDVLVGEETIRAFCRDHALAYAILLAETKGLF